MYEIKTSNYIKTQKILVDGKEWTMHPPGAGDELALAQGKRRAERLEKKVKDGSASDEDLDTYDRIENNMYNIFRKMFKDNTEDNSEVNDWLNATPMVVIMAILEDIQKQAIEKKESESESKPKPELPGTTETEVS